MKVIIWSIAAFLLVFSIVSMVVVKFVYDGQFPRYERHDEKVTASLRYADLEQSYPRRLVRFQSGDHYLQGYVYGSDQERGLVVVAHGLGGGADSYLSQIAYFVNQGWRVFAYDATGSFDSEGKTTRGFPQALLDLDAALSYVETQKELAGLPVMLFGHSWGGYAVANVLHMDHKVAGVVTVSGANAPMDMVIEQARRMMGVFADIQYPYLWLYQRLLFGKAASLNAVDAINRSDVPVLIIHGSEDEMVAYHGASIIARAKALTNPHARTLTVREPGRNGHNSLFRSEAAVNYFNEINAQYRVVYDRHAQNIPYEVRQDFYSKIDRRLAQDLNQDLMAEIQAFFMTCLVG